MNQAGPRPSAAAAYRVPAQPGVADVDRERGRGATAAGDASAVRRDLAQATDADAARGEHTHSETPIPLPRSTAGPGPADAQGRPVVQRASVRGQILDALRAALAAGELTPGEVYSAPALGEQFGVSATPVREAMQQLAIEGAVEVVPNRGFRVVRRGARELAELAEVRALLQVPVILRLARTLLADRWAELRPLAEETARAASSGCRATYGEADRAFHRGMLALAGNEQLVQIADDLHRRTQLPLSAGSVAGTRLELLADAAEHIALLDALMAGDLEAVECLMGNHFGGA
ncbi:GntR family transcriptional regulator [Streptomyces ipomoeae]|uniref:Transcriptional regulator, GntR family n=1 Tax=Streptomyces ipomoeae 91-03 TaxID=698759 RepID=L1KQD4_9ACTN|nr:GntR family transcriptional regulator [Streptomyces ipomoeae]EKX62705.1 transcriptional regulator, GntR family [Streptomyces ipomoeae 91-03]MDX2696619.1 GntR family transcriptional regulator [Streptomyces ipomoeae]MDX2824126.1 GntR family transcriptional regulator [Streptomyces ipomoeae]MDX2842371.1 GntR family transcriptional regulator [Streptomyces ipomoeae]MDX2876765.1 GntR family transcriptional regulator [Streptomyces ipomoeae]